MRRICEGYCGWVLAAALVATILSMPVAVAQTAPRQDGGGDDLKTFVARVLAATEDVWHKAFAAIGQRYQEPILVLYTGVTDAGCGRQSSVSGPVYCETDRKIYLDLSFFEELKRNYKAGGDFAQAYVIAHEVGHHVQMQLGILAKARELEAKLPQQQINALSVRVELQADCLAGVWTNLYGRIANVLQPGHVEQGLAAASALGDDRLQKKATGIVVPETFTHGTSQQRVRWFRRGMATGQIQQCDTFNALEL